MRSDAAVSATKERLADTLSVLGTFVQELEQRLGKDDPQVKEAREELFKLTQLAMGVQREEGEA